MRRGERKGDWKQGLLSDSVGAPLLTWLLPVPCRKDIKRGFPLSLATDMTEPI